MPDLDLDEGPLPINTVFDRLRMSRSHLVVGMEQLAKLRGEQVNLQTPGYPLLLRLDTLCDQLDDVLRAVDPLFELMPPRKQSRS